MAGLVADTDARAGAAAPVADGRTELRVLEDRIELLRGEELVLANPIQPRLLYIPENGPRVAAMLDSGQSAKVGDDWSSFVHVLKEHGLTEEDGASSATLDALVERALADRRQHTLYLMTSDGGERKLDADSAAGRIAEISETLVKGAQLEIVFFGEAGSINMPQMKHIVKAASVRSADALGEGRGRSGGPNASPGDRKQGDSSPTTDGDKALRFSFRITTDLQDPPDGFAAWALASDVTVLAEGPESSLAAIGDLSEAGVRVPVRISVTAVDPSELMPLCEACTEANQGAGLVFSRAQEGASGYPRDEIASAVLEVQRSHLIPLRRMHPQNDWLNRIEFGQGLPWPCGMPTGQVSAFGPAGEIAQCPLNCQQGTAALGVDDLPDCHSCQLRYICGGPCRAAAPGCLFERACIEDLLFEVARSAAGQNHFGERP